MIERSVPFDCDMREMTIAQLEEPSPNSRYHWLTPIIIKFFCFSLQMQDAKTFARLPEALQASIKQAFKTRHGAGEDLGTEADMIEQARRLAAAGYVCAPSRSWVRRLKAKSLNVAKRPYA